MGPEFRFSGDPRRRRRRRRRQLKRRRKRQGRHDLMPRPRTAPPSTNCQLNAPLFGRSLGAHDSCNRENPVRDDLIPYFKVIQVQKCQKGMQT